MPPKPKIDRTWTSDAARDYEPYDEGLSGNHDSIVFGDTVNRPVWRDGQLMVGPFKCTSIGLIPVRENVAIKDKDMHVLAETLRYMQGSLQWLIGDFAITAEHLRWGDLPALAEILGLEYGTLRNWMSVCRNVSLSLRSDKLSFNHHVLVASLPPDQQREALAYALENKLSVAAFRAWLNPRPQKLEASLDDDDDWKASVKALDKLLKAGKPTPKQRREIAAHVQVLEVIILKARSLLDQ